MPFSAPLPLWQYLLKGGIPIVGYLVLAPVLWMFFKDTWKKLDAEALAHNQRNIESGTYNPRLPVLFVITALVLILQEYYGGREAYESYIRPWLRNLETSQATSPGGFGRWIHLGKYGDLYSYIWWCISRTLGYVFIPFTLWKILFRQDNLLDMGLRTRGFFKHAWVYGLCLLVVLPTVYLVSRSPDFGNYYPFYKLCSRSWFDLIAWEFLYFIQFFALEIFFRGFWLSALRTTMGSGAIFAMCVPYCMIHFGKPYLEAAGAVVAGIALGSLAMRTKSIYSGFLVHITVALLMDLLALHHRGAFPVTLFPM